MTQAPFYWHINLIVPTLQPLPEVKLGSTGPPTLPDRFRNPFLLSPIPQQTLCRSYYEIALIVLKVLPHQYLPLDESTEEPAVGGMQGQRKSVAKGHLAVKPAASITSGYKPPIGNNLPHTWAIKGRLQQLPFPKWQRQNPSNPSRAALREPAKASKLALISVSPYSLPYLSFHEKYLYFQVNIP